MSVLIVEDDPSSVAILEALLHEGGVHRIYVETDARLVSGRLAQENPDLVLLDLHMRYVNGYELLSRIQEFANGSYLPVMILTADTTTAARDRGLGDGAQDFLTKPYDTVEASLRIANLLRTRQLYSTLRRTQGAAGDTEATVAVDQENVRSRIQRALTDDETITIAYQPVVDANTLMTVGHEALSRFADGTKPDRWFADAFRVGLGVEFEWLAATRALAFIDETLPDTFLAINMSPSTILRLAERQLCDASLWPRIVIELTEHVPVEDYSALHRALAPMRAAGARLAADDLGAGYAGFRHLLNLEPDIIKLDISLIGGIHRSAAQRSLSRALTAFAADVGALVIAEGVEDAAELTAVRDIGIAWAQGYHLGRPQLCRKTHRQAMKATRA